MFRLKSIILDHLKHTAGTEARMLPDPDKVLIPMSMHIGTPCEPVVKKGDHVLAGQKIGDSEAKMSVPVHASISGTVTDIKDYRLLNGKTCKAVEISSDGKHKTADCSPPEITDKASFLKAVRESGACGLGGAGFPVHIKLDLKKETDTLIINAAECEPYITSDYRQMVEKPDEVLGGIRLVMKYTGIAGTVIAIETNKPDVIEDFEKLTADIPEINVLKLPSVYPQGAEKVLVYSCTGRIVGEGEIPADQKVIVMNVSTVAFLYRYCCTGIPLISRRITVEGTAVKNPLNIFAPVGTMVKELLEFTGTDINDVRKLVAGGPMMGSCLMTADTPVVKTSNSFIADREYTEPVTTSCIRCGRCVRACSMNLMPLMIEKAFINRNTSELKRLRAGLCMNCGACTYVCPANRRLAETNQLAKELIR
ncbi:electron transport complex subunit RsxC [Ruminococcus sp. HUN007]|uniref:electron transport complex subunit RsxC n=1 Tax=Ruminococcus sp. HUN007 TaxID=1514668 RepID=UPI0005D1F949|nr:electron transport complex subunit RsxC [Ruminococcus sp. HUN007]